MSSMHSVRKRIEEHPVLAFFVGAYAITWVIWFPVLTAIDRGWMAYNTTAILVLGVLYEYTRNVAFLGVLHRTFNWQPIVVAGVPVSELAVVVGIPALVLTAWYYRRRASGTNAPEFSPKRQQGVSR